MHFTSTVFLSLLAGALAIPTQMGTSDAPTRILAGRAAVRTFPKASGSTTLSKAQSVTGTFDGGMKRFERNNGCGGQTEGGDSDAVFLVQSGGTLKNVIIGAKQSEGVHCMGPCTIQNVWWEDVCEDALTIKQTSGTSNVIGGGAKGASDKVVQHNGGGTVNIKDFYVGTFGKLYRSCGNCSKQYKRTVTIDGVYAESGKVLVGINSNYGDTATIKNTCAKSVTSICDEYTGNDTGKEPTKKGSGPSSACKYATSDTTVGC